MGDDQQAAAIKLDLAPYGPVKQFTSLTDFEAWLTAEKSAWEPQAQKMQSTGSQAARVAPEQIIHALNRFTKQLNRARDQQVAQKWSDSQTLDAVSAGLASEVQSLGAKYIPSDSPQAIFAIEPLPLALNEACFRLAWFMDIDWAARQRDPFRDHPRDYMRGTLAAELFQRRLLESQPANEQAFTAAQRDWERRFNELHQRFRTDIQGARVDLESRAKTEAAHDQTFNRILEAEGRAFSEVIKLAKETFGQLQETYNKKLSLEASVTYWKRRSNRALLTAVILAIFGIFLGFELVLYALDALREVVATRHPQSWYDLLIPSLVFVVGIWGLRILLKVTFANYHVHLDAGERATMVESYLALGKEAGTAKPEDLGALLSSIFRPGTTGVLSGSDPGPEPTAMQLVRMALSRKASN